MSITRAQFLAGLAGLGAIGALGPTTRLAAAGGAVEPYSPILTPEQLKQFPNKAPRLDPLLVRDFVYLAHGDLARTAELLDRQPALVNATHDWGGGDWETALGGASHMGRPDIANLLLSRGARKDVFCAAMLGDLPLVRAFLEADPQTVNLKGPHGIPLLVHAVKGKQDAVVALLNERSVREKGGRE
jgi:hypothetical protein